MRRAWPVICGAAIAFGIWSETVAFGRDGSARWVPDLAAGCSLIVFGAIAATRQPQNRTGTLLAASGVFWFIPNLASVAGVIGTVAARAILLHRAPLMHAVLAFPTGRVPSRLALGAIVVAYVSVVFPGIWGAELLAILLALAFLAVVATSYTHSVGAVRRMRLIALEVGTVFAGAIATGAVVRLVDTRASAEPLILLAYEASLVIVGLGLLAGLLSPQDAVTDLVVELGEARSGTLRAELARALGDPSLQVGFWSTDREAYVDQQGATLELPDAGTDRVLTIVRREEEPLAALVHDAAVLDDPELVEAVAAAARLYASNARLRVEVQARVRELEASRRRMLDAGDDERRRLERRLHDGAEHRLEDLDELLARAALRARADGTRELVTGAQQQLDQTLEDLSRLANGLHPRVLSELGLQPALEALAQGSPVPVDVHAEGTMPADAELVVYFVCSEALANVAKHARASRVTVDVRRDGDRALVDIEDDGVGGADIALGTGLRGLADRLEAVGGTLSLRSELGVGTCLTAEFPLGGEGQRS